MLHHFIIITHAYHMQLDTHPWLLNKTLIELTFKYSLYNTIETSYTLPSYSLKAPHLSTVCLLAAVYKYRKSLSCLLRFTPILFPFVFLSWTIHCLALPLWL